MWILLASLACPQVCGLRLSSSPVASSQEDRYQWYNATPAEVASAQEDYQRASTAFASALQSRGGNFTVAQGRGNVLAAAAQRNGNATAWKNRETFESWVSAHSTGRGVWKWKNALAAYERHFGPLAGHDVHVAEVGVQSGGSILMWQSVLGGSCHVHGIDINTGCMKFTNGRTTITIGDQADPALWHRFFTDTAPTLDILVDDGGHEAHQMRTTLVEVFYRLQPGGAIAIEDIHGQHYIDSFFTPAANYLAHMANDLESVHVYPFLLIAHKAGQARGLPKVELSFDRDGVVDSFQGVWAWVGSHSGGTVELQNAGWGSFFTAPGLRNFFAYFAGLHDYNYFATPEGCEHTPVATCSVTVVNSPTQSLITGLHIYRNRAIVEAARTPPMIAAVRRGTQWINYGL